VQASRFCPASPPPPPPKANGKNRAFIIRVGYLMTMDQKLGDIVDADVLVKDGKIAKVGKKPRSERRRTVRRPQYE
jgi:imidazolonepropionase-like amidohydrolase